MAALDELSLDEDLFNNPMKLRHLFEGYRDYVLNNMNPHPPGSDEGQAWERGYALAFRDVNRWESKKLEER